MSPYKTGQKDTEFRDYAPLISNASTQRWFLLRQDVPIGFEMLIIKNNVVESIYKPGMKWTSVVPLWHKRGVQAILVDVRDRFEVFNFDTELYTHDQFLLELKFAIHYKIADVKKIALEVKQPLEQLLARTRAKVLDITMKTSIDDFIKYGTNIYIENMVALADDLKEIGLDYKRVDVINFKLPDIARDKFAKVMGENREMLMEIDRLRTMKDKGVINDYMKLELIKGLSNSNFPPLQLYAMQMLGLNSQQAGMAPSGAVSPSRQILDEKRPGLPVQKAREDSNQVKKDAEILDNQATIVKKVNVTQICLINLDTEKIYPLQKDVVTIGRSADNDIIIKDDYASKKHLQLVIGESREIIAINLSSTNSILINKEKEIPPGERLPLKLDDIIEIGYTKYKVVLRN